MVITAMMIMAAVTIMANRNDDDANVGVNDVMKTKMAMKRLMMDNDDEFDR